MSKTLKFLLFILFLATDNNYIFPGVGT